MVLQMENKTKPQQVGAHDLAKTRNLSTCICGQHIPIPPSDTVKYLGLTLDKRLTWKQHIRSKRLILNTRSRTLKHLLSKNKLTKLETKLLIHKSLLKPIWIYGLQLWGSAKKNQY